MKIVNLTPHTIVVYNNEETDIIAQFPSAGTLRVETSKRQVGIAEFTSEIPIYTIDRYRSSDFKTLPPMEVGLFYLVSTIVQEMYPERLDFLAPNTSADSMGAVRNFQGAIIGTKSFVVQQNHPNVR